MAQTAPMAAPSPVDARPRRRVGILALQGDVREHADAIRDIGAEPIGVRLPRDLVGLDALILPGGESTTMRNLIDRYGLREPIRAFADGGAPVFGTCAGMILLVVVGLLFGVDPRALLQQGGAVAPASESSVAETSSWRPTWPAVTCTSRPLMSAPASTVGRSICAARPSSTSAATRSSKIRIGGSTTPRNQASNWAAVCASSPPDRPTDRAAEAIAGVSSVAPTSPGAVVHTSEPSRKASRPVIG